jgi:hypothetical protein
LFKEQRFTSRFSASGRETRHADSERSEAQQPNRLLENAERQGESTERSQRYGSLSREENAAEHSAESRRLLPEGIGERFDQRSRAEKTDSNAIAEEDGNEDDGQTSVSDAAEFFPLLYEDDFNSAEVGSRMKFLFFTYTINYLITSFYSFSYVFSRSWKLKH